MNSWNLTIFPFLIAAVIAGVITPVVIRVYKKFGWVVDPNRTKHPAHTHKEPVPKGGGIAVVLGTLLTVVVLLPIDKHLLAIMLAGALVMIVGVLDDIYDLSPYLRLVTNLLAALMVVGAGIGISYITNPLGGGVIMLDKGISWGGERQVLVLADLLALLWIPFVMNAVNWSKGLDGQLPGIVVVAGVVIGVLSFRYSADVAQWPVAVLAFALAGSYAGYLPFNFYPQKSMPGYGGGSFAGFMLATLAILSTTKIGTALVVLGIPLIDAVYIGIRRIFQGKSPVWGDRGHLHHKLMDLGWGKRKVAVFYWLVTAVLGFMALRLDSRQKFYTMVLVSLLLGAFLLWVSYGRYLGRRGRDSG